MKNVTEECPYIRIWSHSTFLSLSLPLSLVVEKKTKNVNFPFISFIVFFEEMSKKTPFKLGSFVRFNLQIQRKKDYLVQSEKKSLQFKLLFDVKNEQGTKII